MTDQGYLAQFLKKNQGVVNPKPQKLVDDNPSLTQATPVKKPSKAETVPKTVRAPRDIDKQLLEMDRMLYGLGIERLTDSDKWNWGFSILNDLLEHLCSQGKTQMTREEVNEYVKKRLRNE